MRQQDGDARGHRGAPLITFCGPWMGTQDLFLPSHETQILGVLKYFSKSENRDMLHSVNILNVMELDT